MGPHNVHGLRQYLTAVGLILIAIGPAFAQGEATIRGQVLAAANSSALAGVTVTVTPVPRGESVQATTDREGRVWFPKGRPGEYTLWAGPPGFIPPAPRVVLGPREAQDGVPFPL